MTRHAGKLLLALALVVFMVTPAFSAEQYIDDVVHNKITVCKYVKLAVERHLSDLERVGNEDFPYYFDETKAKRVINFIQELRHTKGEWATRQQKLKLESAQQFICWVVYGWRCNDTGLRRFTKAYIEEARKNGKTTFAAGLANYAFMADGEEGAEVYCIATKKDQSKISWGEAERQLQKHPVLRKRIKTYKMNSTVVIPGTASLMKPLGKDSDTEDGLNPHFVLVDEYHAHPTNEMINVMESGMAARTQPLTFIITTAGFDKNKPCYQEERSLIVDILENNLDPLPENIFGIIFTLDEGDDWTDPNVWIKANPNLGVSVKQGYLEKRVQEALLSQLSRTISRQRISTYGLRLLLGGLLLKPGKPATGKPVKICLPAELVSAHWTFLQILTLPHGCYAFLLMTIMSLINFYTDSLFQKTTF